MERTTRDERIETCLTSMYETLKSIEQLLAEQNERKAEGAKVAGELAKAG